jgi:Zn-dependent M28 family amino/carboxypeptidase
MKNRKLIVTLLALDAIIAAVVVAWFFWPQPAPAFDAERAYNDVLAQTNFGPRIPGSPAHTQTVDYIVSELQAAGWTVTLQETTYAGQNVRNISATRSNLEPKILLGAHYDSRLIADHDPDPTNHNQPVPGANDGASGAAVLLEIARVLPEDSISVGLVFFDAEDNGHIPGWDWILGSRAFAEALTYRPEAFVLVDMIGDADLNIFKERNSDPELTDAIWAEAQKLGYESAFIPDYKYRVIDDHIPFLEKGIRSVDIIDLDYPHYHTLQDTPDKVSPQSLKMVGDTLLAWLGMLNP